MLGLRNLDYYQGKIDALNDTISFINTLEVKEFDMPVLDNRKMSVERWKEACKAACSDRNYRSHYGFTETRDDYFVDGVQWADEHPEIKEEDLEKEIEKYLLTNAAFLIVGDSKLVVHHIAEHFFKLGIQKAKKE